MVGKVYFKKIAMIPIYKKISMYWYSEVFFPSQNATPLIL